MYLLPQDFETERLSIDYHSEENWQEWLPFFKEESNLKYLGQDLSKTKEQLCLEWSARQRGRYEEGHGAVLFRLKQNKALVGNSGLILKNINDHSILEVGYSLLKEYQGQGLATEMAMAIRDYGFNYTDQNILYSTIHPGNQASQRVAEKNGMTKGELTSTKGFPIELWSITRKEWETAIRPNSPL